MNIAKRVCYRVKLDPIRETIKVISGFHFFGEKSGDLWVIDFGLES